MLARQSGFYVTVCAAALGCPQSKSVKSKPVLGWCCCCVHMHTPWAACNRSPSFPLRNLHSTPHPHPHAQMPVASCFPVLSSATDIKAALDPALSLLSLLLLPSASHWVLVLLELPCATLVLDSSTRLKDTAQGSLSLLYHPPLAGCLLAGRVSVSSWRRLLQVS